MFDALEVILVVALSCLVLWAGWRLHRRWWR